MTGWNVTSFGAVPLLSPDCWQKHRDDVRNLTSDYQREATPWRRQNDGTGGARAPEHYGTALASPGSLHLRCEVRETEFSLEGTVMLVFVRVAKPIEYNHRIPSSLSFTCLANGTYYTFSFN